AAALPEVALDARHRRAGQAAEEGGGLLSGGVEALGRHDAVNESELERARRLDALTGEDEPTGGAGADLVGQLLNASWRQPAERHLGCREDGTLLREPVVGVQRKEEPPAEGAAADRGEDRHVEAGERVAQRGPPSLLRDDRFGGDACEATYVAALAEHRRCPAQDDDAAVRVFDRRSRCGEQRVQELVVER